MRQVIATGVELLEVVGRAVGGLVFRAAESALGISGGGSVGGSFVVHPDRLEQHAATRQQHTETIGSLSKAFQSKLSGVSFE